VVEKSSGRVEAVSYSEAFTLIAEGTQCGVTGTAFEHLLQHAEPDLIEAVLQTLVVAARMRSRQKAQLVSMLSSKGVTLPNNKQFRVTVPLPICCLLVTHQQKG